MERGHAEAIVEGVRSAVTKWPGYAEQAGVMVWWRKQIQRNHRLELGG